MGGHRWGWTIVIIAAGLLLLYALWDFVWVQFIHGDAVNPRP
jgi:hypothetical protein